MCQAHGRTSSCNTSIQGVPRKINDFFYLITRANIYEINRVIRRCAVNFWGFYVIFKLFTFRLYTELYQFSKNRLFFTFLLQGGPKKLKLLRQLNLWINSSYVNSLDKQ